MRRACVRSQRLKTSNPLGRTANVIITHHCWIYASPLSTAIRDILWVIPTVQSIHILAITVLFGSAVISDLRLAGVFATDEPLRGVVRRYYPWMRNALLVLLFTGLIMIIAEPDRVLVNSTFWLKMALVVSAFTLTLLLRRPFCALPTMHNVMTSLLLSRR